jgi:HemK-related putative methylase
MHYPIINNLSEIVYHPSDDTFLFLDYFKEMYSSKNAQDDLKRFKNILDMGTGTGIIAIFFALLSKETQNFNAHIYASDILKEALLCAKKNEKENGLKNSINYIHSDLFSSFPKTLKNIFDIIVFNPPYLPSFDQTAYNTQNKKDLSWDGGIKGYEVLKRFLKRAPSYLNTTYESSIYYISSSRMDLEAFYSFLQSKGYKNEIIKKKHIFFEDILLNKLTIPFT